MNLVSIVHWSRNTQDNLIFVLAEKNQFNKKNALGRNHRIIKRSYSNLQYQKFSSKNYPIIKLMRSRDKLLKLTDLKPMSTDISGLIKRIKSTPKPVPNNQMSDISKLKFVELVNEFEAENNYSVKRAKFLQGLENQHLRNLFRGLTKYHHDLGHFSVELLNKGMEVMNRAHKFHILSDIQFDIKRITEYLGCKIVNEYRRNLDMKLVRMKKNKEQLHLKMEQVKHHPELSLIKPLDTGRILMGIHERKTDVEFRYGKFALISDVQSQKERILQQIRPSLL